MKTELEEDEFGHVPTNYWNPPYIIPHPYNFLTCPDSKAHLNFDSPSDLTSCNPVNSRPPTSSIRLPPLLPRPQFKLSLPSLLPHFPLWCCTLLVSARQSWQGEAPRHSLRLWPSPAHHSLFLQLKLIVYLFWFQYSPCTVLHEFQVCKIVIHQFHTSPRLAPFSLTSMKPNDFPLRPGLHSVPSPQDLHTYSLNIPSSYPPASSAQRVPFFSSLHLSANTFMHSVWQLF